MKTFLLYLCAVVFFSCSEDFVDSNAYGCMDENACNYLPSNTKDDGSCIYPKGSTCIDGCTAIDSWEVDISVSLLDDTSCQYSLDDTNNTIGLNMNGSDGYDEGLDVVDPPNLSCIRFYFEHEDWGQWSGDYFTSDYQSSGFHSTYSDKVSWSATVENQSGSRSRVSVSFDPRFSFNAFYEVLVDGYSYSFFNEVGFVFLMEVDQKSSIIINVWNTCEQTIY